MAGLVGVIPCVTFILHNTPDPPQEDHVHISPGPDCSATIGRQGGPQGMSLERSMCMDVGLIMHEMIHSLGFFHEQARPDRDDYVNIFPDNIQDEQGHNFDKLNDDYVTTFGVPYNTRSIMHYGSHDFSKNDLPTILAKDGSDVGSTGSLQQTDIDKLKIMYNC